MTSMKDVWGVATPFLAALASGAMFPRPVAACSLIDIDASVKHASMMSNVYWLGCVALCVACLGINESRANRSTAVRALCLILPVAHPKLIFSAEEYLFDCSFPLLKAAIGSFAVALVLVCWTGFRASKEAWQRL